MVSAEVVSSDLRTISLPNGAKAAPATLKLATQRGMPMIVIQSRGGFANNLLELVGGDCRPQSDERTLCLTHPGDRAPAHAPARWWGFDYETTCNLCHIWQPSARGDERLLAMTDFNRFAYTASLCGDREQGHVLVQSAVAHQAAIKAAHAVIPERRPLRITTMRRRSKSESITRPDAAARLQLQADQLLGEVTKSLPILQRQLPSSSPRRWVARRDPGRRSPGNAANSRRPRQVTPTSRAFSR
jgi:hypothetical protein